VTFYSAVGAVALGDQLYVCGGFDGISSLDTVEKFDPMTNTWTLVASMTKNRSAAGKSTVFVAQSVKQTKNMTVGKRILYLEPVGKTDQEQTYQLLVKQSSIFVAQLVK